MIQCKPLHKRNLILKDLGDEFLIYSPEHKEIHVVNPTAQLIWNMCDGEHSMSDIEKEIRTHFSIPPERDIMGDIQNTLNIFRNKGLLENEVELG
jgi:hypothetical protein